MTIIKSNWKFLLLIILLISADLITILGTFEITSYIRENFFAHSLPEFRKYSIEKFSWVIILLLIMLTYEKIYFKRFDFWTDTKRIFKALFLSFIAVLSVIALVKASESYSRSFIFLFFFFSAFAIPFTKRYVKKILFSFDIFKLKVNVIGQSKRKKEIRKEIKSNWYFGYSYNKKEFDIVLISSEGYNINELELLMTKYSMLTKDLYLVPYLNSINFAEADIIEYFNIRSSAINIENKLLVQYNVFVKAFVEFLMSLFILPIFLFIHIVISLLIKLDSRGPIVFKQKRLGKNQELFSCYKYRTMYVDSEKLLENYLIENPDEVEYYNKYHKYKNDPRITKIGCLLRKTSLDELPQLINVLQGKMSLIGPRPYMVEESCKLVDEIDTILRVRPGITGLWQVSGRNDLDFEERKQLDIWYIRNWSLWLDFVILMKTVKVVLSKVGAR